MVWVAAGDLLKNPAGLIVVSVLGVLLIGGVSRGMYLYACKHSRMTPKDILVRQWCNNAVNTPVVTLTRNFVFETNIAVDRFCD